MRAALLLRGGITFDPGQESAILSWTASQCIPMYRIVSGMSVKSVTNKRSIAKRAYESSQDDNELTH